MEDVALRAEPKGSLLGTSVDELEIDRPGADKGREPHHMSLRCMMSLYPQIASGI
jgi:hypothetical protein